jgi:hypothetical protein
VPTARRLARNVGAMDAIVLWRMVDYNISCHDESARIRFRYLPIMLEDSLPDQVSSL